MAHKKKFWTNFTFCLIVLISVFDKQANIHCCTGSISRPISSRDHNATDQVIEMDRYQSYFRKLDNFFCGKQQDAARSDKNIYSLLVYDFCIVVRVFKEATSLSIFPTAQPFLAQQRKQMKSINFNNNQDINLIIGFGNYIYPNRDYY